MRARADHGGADLAVARCQNALDLAKLNERPGTSNIRFLTVVSEFQKPDGGIDELI
jgi:hypothetical protein